MKTRRYGLIVAACLILPYAASAQGTLFISNVDDPTAEIRSISSDLWHAQVFFTGPASERYSLDSISLQMDTPVGLPAGFEVSIYSSDSLDPGVSLEALTGPEPSTSGVFSYDSDSGLLLAPSSYYYVVTTAATSAAQGSYTWSLADYNGPSGGWNISDVGVRSSTDGSNWMFAGRQNVFQMAVYATVVPEPSAAAFLASGALALGFARWRGIWQ